VVRGLPYYFMLVGPATIGVDFVKSAQPRYRLAGATMQLSVLFLESEEQLSVPPSRIRTAISASRPLPAGKERLMVWREGSTTAPGGAGNRISPGQIIELADGEAKQSMWGASQLRA